MQRKFYILAVTIGCTLLALISFHPALRIDPIFRQTSQSSVEWSEDSVVQTKTAFATVINNPAMLEASVVSIYSLKKHTGYGDFDILVLVPENVPLSNQSILQLEKLGDVIWIPSSPYSNASCGSIIYLWSLTSYEKIVYFTPDVLFTQDADPLLRVTSHSAIIPQSAESWPLLVLKPDKTIFNTLTAELERTQELALPSILTQYSLRWKVEGVPEGVFLFSGPLKPWAFHYYSNSDWLKYYDPVAFYNWRTTQQEVQAFLEQDSEWPNQARQRTVCDAYDPTVSFPVQDQFSVLLSTYTPERIDHLASLIEHLLQSPSVHTVFVTWHNPNLEVPKSILINDRVRVLRQAYDSLNNRFNPVSELVTEAVYIMDDDVLVDLDDLSFTFLAWQSQKDSVVGHFPRIHSYDPVTQTAQYKVSRPTTFYSMILTKSMFIRSEYLYAYTCLLDPALHHIIDNQLNCEDIAFSMLATGLSGANAVHVLPSKPIVDYGLAKGISTNTKHMPARSKCVADFITQFWNAKDPLKVSHVGVTPFQLPQIVRGKWSKKHS
ncbi:Exostoses (Multiple)-like 3 [Apophysomyces ossiformis]|uniref:Exostoses (Multiple)-like 3 n=1 Tax=Apophysomyces ossiformis TaxID=679940 RepID=A0A8H7EU83_9FUNG|nr:Exostoses (Multiple)-like 3 [Apophysomyces ossiformis]